MTGTALEVEKMSVRRSAAGVCHRLDIAAFHLHAGEMVALTGPSGCGKSTFLDLLALVLWPDRLCRMVVRIPGSGRSRDVTAIARGRVQSEAARLRADAYGYVLQTGGLFSFLTVRENLMVADPSGSSSRRERRDRLDYLAGRLDIERQLGKRPGELSVGERQRAAIVRALLKRPSLLLADEPTANLDPQSSRNTLELLRQEAEESGIAALVVSHDQEMVRDLGLVEWRLEARRDDQGEAGCDEASPALVTSRLYPPLAPGPRSPSPAFEMGDTGTGP